MSWKRSNTLTGTSCSWRLVGNLFGGEEGPGVGAAEESRIREGRAPLQRWEDRRQEGPDSRKEEGKVLTD